MDNVYDLIMHLNKTDVVINAEIESYDLLSYTQSFYFTVSETVYESYTDLFSEFYEHIIVNGFEFSDDPDIEEENEVQISISNNFFSDNKENFNKFILYDKKIFYKFIDFFFKGIKISDLRKIKTKANIEFLTETNISLTNCIFNLDASEEKIFIPEILLFDGYYSSIKITALPNIVPQVPVELLLKDIVKSQFELMSNHFIDDDKFIIYSDKTVSFEMNDIKLSKELRDDIEAIILFVFEDERHYYDKLEIFKNIFSVGWLKQKEVSKELSEGLLDDIKSQYSLYVSDSLDKFIQDKQIITDKYIAFMQSISEHSKRVSDEIQKQILTLIGIVISTFFITGVEEGIGLILPSLLGLVYLGISYYLKFKSGWLENTVFLKKEIEFMNNTYGELYKFDSTYTNGLLKEYVSPEIKKLELAEKRFQYIYIVFLVIFCVWFLYSLLFSVPIETLSKILKYFFIFYRLIKGSYL